VPSTTARTEPAGRPAGGVDRRRAAGLATLVALPVTLALVLLFARLGGADPEPAPTPAPTPQAALPPVAVAPPAPDAAGQRACRRLVAALPAQLGDRPARQVRASSPYVAAWGEPAVVLRCGVARPPSFLSTVEVQDINGVTWFPERRGGTTAWTAVDRAVYVEVLAPVEDASASVARLSAPVAGTLARKAVDPAD
jgi:hypothetical protein